MPDIDHRKTLKHLYTAAEPALVDIPPLNFLMLDGQGDPNTSQAYKAAVEALFSLSYALKFQIKRAGTADYAVMPLEGLWWVEDLNDLPHKERWFWTMLIMQPEWVTPELVAQQQAEIFHKKKLETVRAVRFENYAEGLSAQILHTGSYAAEQPTIERLHSFIHEQGYALRGKHHEIYLSDATRTAPERLKTIIRQPIEQRT